jgi:type II secretory pathway pseudopilin PulG
VTSKPAKATAAFTLVEVMAAVLVLGLLYTVLASSAMRGLRSEGIDRRRADAEMVADRELTEIETELANGAPFEDGLTEREEAPYKVSSDIEPFDVFALLPRALGKEIAQGRDPKAPSVLHDERGQSRIRRISVMVAWDEAGEPAAIERTTFAYDAAAIAELLPAPAGTPGANEAAESEMDKVRKMAPPELQKLMPPGKTSARQGRGRSR